MLKKLKVIIPVAVFVTGLIMSTAASFGKVEYSKKEKKPCTACHTKMGSKDLNDAGKYYGEKKTLDGYKKK